MGPNTEELTADKGRYTEGQDDAHDKARADQSTGLCQDFLHDQPGRGTQGQTHTDLAGLLGDICRQQAVEAGDGQEEEG